MPRIPGKHSSNWGGARRGAGGGKPKGPNRMTAKAIKMAEESDLHPLTFLLQVIADDKQTIKDRLAASTPALPYVLSRKATELHVSTGQHDNHSDEDIMQKILETQRERKMLTSNVIEGETVDAG